MTATITHGTNGIDVRAHAPRIRWQWLVVASWLPFVAAGAVATYITVGSLAGMFAKGQYLAAVLFSAGAVIVFLGCIAGTISALYGMYGVEHVHADSGGITTYQEFGPFRLRQHYPPYRIRNVRAFVPEGDWGRWSPPPSRVIFDTPGRVRGFGSSLTQKEAAEVASAISEQLAKAESVEGPGGE